MSISKKCAREECGKTVYPTEELKCLDKVWHKGCFKCSVCGMTLSMKNYKGYEKKPYCEAHYPKTVASVVTDTPEMRRLAENTKFQSQINYHADYEKMKGTKIEIADDPEMTRHRQNTKVQSQVQYHGDIERKKQQESNRPKEELTNSLPSTASNISFYSTNSNLNTAASTQSLFGDENNSNSEFVAHQNARNSVNIVAAEPRIGAAVKIAEPLKISNQNSSTLMTQQNYGNSLIEKPLRDSPYSQRLAQQYGAIVYSSERGGEVPAENRQVGSIADYDPLNGNWGTSAASKNAEKIAAGSQQKQQQQKLPESTTPISQTKTQATTKTAHQDIGKQQQQKKVASQPTGFCVKALYDYTAADKDEISFKENDIIVNCQKVDEGWMTGTVQKTLQWGMLPANYVERINQPIGLFKLN